MTSYDLGGAVYVRKLTIVPFRSYVFAQNVTAFLLFAFPVGSIKATFSHVSGPGVLGDVDAPRPTLRPGPAQYVIAVGWVAERSSYTGLSAIDDLMAVS